MRPSRGVISMQWPRTVGDAFVQLANKVEARSDVVDIHKKLPGLEHVLQSVEPTAGVFGVIASPIIDKYLSRHRPRRQRSSHCGLAGARASCLRLAQVENSHRIVVKEPLAIRL